MIRHVLIPDLPVGFTWFCWIVSLRRTPWPVQWAALCLLFSPLWYALGSLASYGHSNMIGLIGIASLMCLPALFALLGTEGSDNSAASGDLYKWRQAHAKFNMTAWRIEAKQSDGSPSIRIAITNGSTTRRIGSVDPLEDWNEYLNLKAKADQAAQTYNDLQIR